MTEKKKIMFEEFLAFIKKKEEEQEEADWATEYLMFSDEESVKEDELKEEEEVRSDEDIITIKEDSDEITIDNDVLALLGKENSKSPENAPKIHDELAKRWNNILNKGLVKEEKERIVEKYPPIENVPRLRTPKLYPEAQAAMSEVAVKRDGRISSKQTQVGVAISALGGLLSELLTNKETSKTVLIERISDAGRILCEVYHNENKARRFLVLENLNKDLRQSLQSREPQEFLFGDNLSEGIRNAKAVARAAQDLKVPRKNLNFEARSTPLQHKQFQGRRNVGRGGHHFKRPALLQEGPPAKRAANVRDHQKSTPTSYPPRPRARR